MKTAEIEVTLLDHMGSDLSVANAARVSFHKESKWEKGSTLPDGTLIRGFIDVLSDRDAKLIKYLATHEHKSPFNHCFASFRVKAPIFVARQLVKHKFLPWNEVSRRYVDDEPEFYFPDVWRKRHENAKQGSSDEAVEFTMLDPMSSTACALTDYKEMLRDGVCPEQARMILPQNTMTEWIWSGSLGAFADMCRLRLDPHAQKESRDVAELIAKEMRNLFPVSFDALISV